MPILTCRNVADKASPFMDGELGRLMRLRIRVHLTICPACMRYFQQLKAVVGATRQLASSDGEQDVHDVVDDLMKRFDQIPAEPSEQ